MDNPEAEIEGVIRQLCQTPPSTQRRAIETYFTSDAAFCHPLCRTGSFDGSRFLIRAIYRWYKIMSPRIELEIESVAYDPKHLLLYVSIFQIFRIQFVPFFKAPVYLTTVLKLRRDTFSDKYYIASQNDLYQMSELSKFFMPGGFIVLWVWQFFATLVCLAMAALFWPISWLEEHGPEVTGSVRQAENRVKQVAMPEDVFEREKGSGRMITAPAVERR
ncbi:MAG: hypothetical protein M1828_007039 [Chrysothrix sp. TS-e1954]|nr:MAG: hypothetical protein M1828_007039 [Chrysothrix sp. TS-e1954]